MKVELNNGDRFLANFRYNAKPSFSADPVHDDILSMVDIHSSDYGSFDSLCGQTMVGFVQKAQESSTMTEHKVGCFYA